MGRCGRHPARSRRHVLIATGTAAVLLPGCVGDDGGAATDLVVNETIAESQTWTLELEPGDQLRIVAEDGSDTTLIGYGVDPPGGRGTSHREVAVDRTVEAEEGGEYVVRIEPSQETDVRIYRS